MDTLEITQATPDIMDEIWPFMRQIAAEGRTYAWPPDVSREMAPSLWFFPNARVYAARMNGELAGTFYLRPNHLGPASHTANGGFMVNPRFAGGGVCTRMGEHAMSEARRLGYRAMQFNMVVSTNLPSVAVWKKLGFTEIARVPEGYCLPDGNYVDSLILHRKL